MSELQVGDTVHFNRDDPTKLKCPFFVVERFRTKTTHYWSGNKKILQHAPGIEIAPCNSRTLIKVPGRKTRIEYLSSVRRLNVLEALARVS